MRCSRGISTRQPTTGSIDFSTTPGLDVFQWKRSQDVKYYVHLLHSADIADYEMFGVDFYDSILLGAEHQEANVRELEELRGETSKELYYIGVPYWDELLKRINENRADSNTKRTILIAPSWGARSKLLKQYGERIIDELLENGYHVILRPHPQSFRSEISLIQRFESRYGDKIEWNRDTDNFNVLNRADIMISECSGVVYDFACVFDKPVICLNSEPELGVYDVSWLKKTQYWTLDSLSEVGEILTEGNLSDLNAMINRCLTDDKYSNKRKQLRDETWVYQGEGAVKASDYLIEKYNKLAFGEESV